MEVFMRNTVLVGLLAAAALLVSTISINVLTPSTTQAQAANCIDLTTPENISINWQDRKA